MGILNNGTKQIGPRINDFAFPFSYLICHPLNLCIFKGETTKMRDK